MTCSFIIYSTKIKRTFLKQHIETYLQILCVYMGQTWINDKYALYRSFNVWRAKLLDHSCPQAGHWTNTQGNDPTLCFLCARSCGGFFMDILCGYSLRLFWMLAIFRNSLIWMNPEGHLGGRYFHVKHSILDHFTNFTSRACVLHGV